MKDVERPVGGAIVHGNHLEVVQRLLENAVKAFAQMLLGIVARYDNRYLGIHFFLLVQMSDALLEREPEFGKGKDVFAVVVVGTYLFAHLLNSLHRV